MKLTKIYALCTALMVGTAANAASTNAVWNPIEGQYDLPLQGYFPFTEKGCDVVMVYKDGKHDRIERVLDCSEDMIAGVMAKINPNKPDDTEVYVSTQAMASSQSYSGGSSSTASGGSSFSSGSSTSSGGHYTPKHDKPKHMSTPLPVPIPVPALGWLMGVILFGTFFCTEEIQCLTRLS